MRNRILAFILLPFMLIFGPAGSVEFWSEQRDKKPVFARPASPYATISDEDQLNVPITEPSAQEHILIAAPFEYLTYL